MSAQIQEVLQKMRLDYVANLPQRLDAIEAMVRALGPGNAPEDNCDNLHRAVHSLKGTAGTYGVAIISTVCRPFEDYVESFLEDYASAGDAQIRTCMCFIDLLRRAQEQVAAGRESFPDIEASLASISGIALPAPSGPAAT